MSKRRKPTGSASSRKPQFPIDTLPPEIARIVRAVAKAEKVTVEQAAIAALIAVSDTIGPGIATLADGLDIQLSSLDIEFLIP